MSLPISQRDEEKIQGPLDDAGAARHPSPDPSSRTEQALKLVSRIQKETLTLAANLTTDNLSLKGQVISANRKIDLLTQENKQLKTAFQALAAQVAQLQSVIHGR